MDEKITNDIKNVITAVTQTHKNDTLAVFDPRIKFRSKKDEENAAVVWSTKSIELAIEAISEGRGLRLSPFLKSDPNLRKPNLLFQYTEEEIIEILKCKKDIIYFAEKYVLLKTDNGLSNIKLRNYQKRLLRKYQDNRWNITLQPRQSGKTTTTAIFFTHYSLFNVDKCAAIAAQRDQIAGEVFSKIKNIIYYLPFFLKPGCISFGGGGYRFDNGCSAIYRPATIDCLQGYSVDLLFVDEFAYIRNKKAKEFWENVYPTLSASSLSRVIITSTPNGRNLFHELWTRAIEGKNLFSYFRIDWWEVPGRDEAWRKRETANLGSEAAFDQQYGLSFDTGIRNTLTAETFRYLNKISTEFNYGLFNIGTDWDDKFRWSTNWKYSFKNDYFILSIDIAEGMGGDGDYSVIKLKKLFLDNESNIIMPTIGIFECNSIIIEDFAKVILLLMRKFNQEQCRLIIERNAFGDLLVKNIESLSEHMKNVDIEVEVFAKFRRSIDNKKFEKGLRLNSSNKKAGVANWKKLVDDKMFIETDSRTIDQYREFGDDGKGNFKASVGHDDLVMPDVNAAYYIKSNNPGWNEFIECFKDSSKTDIFNTDILHKLNISVLNQIAIETTFTENEYDLDVDIVDLMEIDGSENEYTEIDKYLITKEIDITINTEEYNVLPTTEFTRFPNEVNMSREDRNMKIASELV